MAGHGPERGGGVSVLLVTALVALLLFIQPGVGPTHYLAGLAAVILLLGGAWLLARFVGRHGDEIGEARFDTRNKDEREG